MATGPMQTHKRPPEVDGYEVPPQKLEIGRLIQHNLFFTQPEEMLQRVTHFVEHLKREDQLDDVQHQRQLPSGATAGASTNNSS